jgi:hypothetical protein
MSMTAVQTIVAWNTVVSSSPSFIMVDSNIISLLLFRQELDI